MLNQKEGMMEMKPETYYQVKEEENKAELKSLQSLRNRITVGKLITFIGMGTGLYFFSTQVLIAWLLMTGVCLVLFIGLTLWDSRVLHKIRWYEIAVKCCRVEIDYLQRKYTDLEKGNKYRQSAHPYAEDLDILGENSLFMHVNRTVTKGGQDMLASWLLALSKEEKEIVERQEAAAELAADPDWCCRYRIAGKLFGLMAENAGEMERWLLEPPFFKRTQNRVLVFLLNVFTILMWVGAVASVLPYFPALFLSLVQLAILGFYFNRINTYYKRLGDFGKVFSDYFYLLRLLKEKEFVSVRMKKLKQGVFAGEKDAVKAFRELKGMLNGFDQRNNILIGSVRNALYMSDFHFLSRLDKWRDKYRPEVEKWLNVMYETDALQSMAVYRFNHPSYQLPCITEDCWLQAQEVGHPFIPQEYCVHNDFYVSSVHNLYVITGANMAGKSTFLRTIGVNLVLALSGNVVCASVFRVCLMDLFTSMRTTDNLTKGTSYFHAELLRLKQLIDRAGHTGRLFIILDEMLKGTNSQDKLNGSFRFLEKLLDYPVSGIIATHDLALGELAGKYPGRFFNYCFEITHSAEDIHYDYKLKEGVSRNMNATILLEKMGLI